MRARAVVPWLVLAALLLAVAAIAGTSASRDDRPLDPAANGPRGAKALVVLLEELGADVEPTDGAPPTDAETAVLLADRLDRPDRDQLRAWVRGGGVLVVADRSSPLHRRGTGQPCPPALADVDELRLGPGASGRIGRGDRCFDGFVTVVGAGEGDIVSVGDPTVFANELLGEADNAVLAASLLAPTGAERVAFLRGGPGSGDEQLLDLLGPGVAQAIAQLGVAFVVYALWRGRRLGRPVAESQPVAVAGSELVAAVGRMLGGRKRPGEAAGRVRAELRRALERRLGLPAGAPTEQLAGAVAARSGLEPGWVAAALVTRPVVTDDDLVAVLGDLDRIRTAALGPAPTPSTAGGAR